MKHESYENTFEVKKTQESFSDWLNKPYISPNLQKSLVTANLLIIPIEGVRDYKGPVFPDGTADLFLYLKENAQNKIIPEICIDDEDYVELVMHWDLITIGTIIVTDLVAPLAVNIIYDFLKARLGQKFSKTHVKIEIIIDKEGQSTHIFYEGPSEELSDKILPVVKKISEK